MSAAVPEVIHSPHFWRGRRFGSPIAVVIHTMAGTLAGCDAWFTNPASQVSAHYGVALTGDFHRYVSRFDTAWANGLLEPGNVWPWPAINPNWLTVSIETEDLGDPGLDVTEAQYATVRTLTRTMVDTFPTIYLVMPHSAITPKSRPHCPGSRWDGHLAALADETGLTLRTV